EEDLREARLLLRQRENCLVDDLDSESGAYTLATRIRHMEGNAGVIPRLVDPRIRRGLNLQLVRRLDKDDSMIRNRLGISAEQVCIEIHHAGEIRCRGKRHFSLPMSDVDVAGQNRLAIFHY